MKNFIKDLLIFLGILFAFILIGTLMPATPRATTSHMFGKLKMDSLLRNVPSPRLILLGGSNLSLTINSKLLKDSLNLNPINTAISWNIGFVYMFENTLRHVKPGDVIVASLEYNQFSDKAMYGGHDLVRTIFDVAPSDFYYLRPQQYVNMIPHIPAYAISKFKPGEYLFERDPLEIYDRNAINEFGDNSKHWTLPGRTLRAEPALPLYYDRLAFDLLKEFETSIRAKGATLLITFPALQQQCFEAGKAAIKAIEKEIADHDFIVMGYPERYVMPDTLMFDTPYHLIKQGVDLRTELLIEDIRTALHLTGPTAGRYSDGK
jgi:hypothetical protein